MLKSTGYFCATSIQAIRRQLGKKVDERYTDVQRSQHLTQADPRVFNQSYVANTSSVDGQAAFLGETSDHTHIDYFQGLEKFREPGLPCELPAHVEQRLNDNPQLRGLETEVQALLHRDAAASKEARRRLRNYRRALKQSTLRQYQEAWVQERRDWKILTRGKEQPGDIYKSDVVQNLSASYFLNGDALPRKWPLMSLYLQAQCGMPHGICTLGATETHPSSISQVMNPWKAPAP